jgi:hypothetical protein
MGRTSTTTEELEAIDRSLKRTHALFSSQKPLDCSHVERKYVHQNQGKRTMTDCFLFVCLFVCLCSLRMRLVTKTYDEYRDCKTLPSAVLDQQAGQSGPSRPPHQQTHRSITAGPQAPLRIQGICGFFGFMSQQESHFFLFSR